MLQNLIFGPTSKFQTEKSFSIPLETELSLPRGLFNGYEMVSPLMVIVL